MIGVKLGLKLVLGEGSFLGHGHKSLMLGRAQPHNDEVVVVVAFNVDANPALAALSPKPRGD